MIDLHVHHVTGARVKVRALGLNDKGRDLGYAMEVTLGREVEDSVRVTVFCDTRDDANTVLCELSAAMSSLPDELVLSLSAAKIAEAQEASARG